MLKEKVSLKSRWFRRGLYNSGDIDIIIIILKIILSYLIILLIYAYKIILLLK